MAIEVYKVELMDGEHANIFIEQVPETMDDAFARHTRTINFLNGSSSGNLFNPSKVVLGTTWEFVIRIGGTELYGRRLGVAEKRHVLLHAWERLQKEGIMPGATLERVG